MSMYSAMFLLVSAPHSSTFRSDALVWSDLLFAVSYSLGSEVALLSQHSQESLDILKHFTVILSKVMS